MTQYYVDHRFGIVLIFGLLFLFIAGLTAAPHAAFAADSVATEAKPAARPKIGLVLGGGGARGSAHVGVLKVIEELRIPIDYIAGNSMGAIVGGLYASGMTPDQIAHELKTIDWDDTFNDDPARPDRTFRRKRDDDFYLAKARLGMRDGEVQFPFGLIQGQKFDLHLSRLTLRSARIHDFNKLPTPFRAVATDIETGQEVLLQSGNLARSIRASMAVPGGFDPVEIDGKLLVDGLVANNVPVNIARDMGADILIVVDVGSGLSKREDIKSVLSVVGQLTNILSQRNVDLQLATLKPNDIFIKPELGKLGAGDFNKAAEGIEKGEQAARAMIPTLQRLSIDLASYRQLMAKREVVATPPVVDFVRLDNKSRISDAVILARISLQPGQPLDPAKMDADIGEVYGLDVFESVRYEVVQENGQSGVVLHAKEKTWGPNYLQFGLELTDDFQGDTSYNLGVLYTRTAINALNGELRLALQLGQDNGLAAELYQPLDVGSKYFLNARIAAARNRFQNYKGDDVSSEFNIRRLGIDLAAGRNFGTWGEGRIGYRRAYGTTDVVVGDPTLDGYNFHLGQLYARLYEDKLDNVLFPTAGNKAILELSTAKKSLGSDSSFNQGNLNYVHAYTWGRNTVVGGLRYNTTFNDNAPVESRYRLGGFLRLSGYAQNQLSGQHSGVATAAIYRNFSELKILPAFIGASIEYGNVWQRKADIDLGDGLLNGSVFVGSDTPIGPLYVGLGLGEGGHRTGFMFLGSPF
ncbi:MAG: patatin-like phospholipase family protein [Burkholderiales bacterium]|nr:patatin-like phospholipase family protein [Burkholderiales bacterium]